MRRLKKEIFDRLTDFGYNLDTFTHGSDFKHDFSIIGTVGAHERREAIDALVECSILHYGTEPDIKEDLVDEIKEKIETLINYLEFHHYFYGVSPLPSCLCFCEDKNKQLATFSKSMKNISWNEFKSFLQKGNAKAVIVYAVMFADGEWTVRMNTSDIKLIYDNTSYIEYYKPNEK